MTLRKDVPIPVPARGDEVEVLSRRSFLGKAATLGGLGLLFVFAEPINRLLNYFTPISRTPSQLNTGTAYEQNKTSFEGALNKSDIRELRGLIGGPEQEKNIVEILRKSAGRLDSTNLSEFNWDTETLNFNRRFFTIIDKFCRSLIGTPSAELTWLMKGNTPEVCGRIPIFPHVPMGAESSFGNAVIPTQPYRITSEPDYPYGLYVLYDDANPSPLTTGVHEYIHAFLGHYRTATLENMGYGTYAHGLVDDIVRIIRSEGFGYYWRDDRGVRGTPAQRQVIAVDASDTTSSYAYPDPKLTPLLHAYKKRNTNVFKEIVSSIK